ncbi:hypothetical protein J5X07_11605 [Actinomyces bowdenii]|uniref:hypothetical protein n=1 Tax=Actinomyces bowdenii TaxID=131109 RepID=UPI001ABC751F|nr:hypothetical protein [Actinomyces bowdenii]MBO3725660.1 hypothetical protein [Actinomyces bowdenii]
MYNENATSSNFIPKDDSDKEELLEDRSTIYSQIEALENSYVSWRSRSIITLDFADGAGTYVEHLSIDIDKAKFEESINHERSEHYYIPLGWRQRHTFLEFDCKANSGESLQLMPLSFRHGYTEWRFLKSCQRKLSSSSSLPSCIRDHIVAVINGTANLRQGVKLRGQSCANHSTQCEELWNSLMSDPEIYSDFLRMRSREPLILKAKKSYDFSILKLRERRTLDFPHRKLKQAMLATGPAALRSRRASSIKIVVPPDVRIKSAALYDMQQPTPYQASLYGDGSWAHINENHSSDIIKWAITFYPRRAHTVTPGLLILLFGICLCIYWYFSTQRTPLSDWNEQTVGLFAKRPSYAFLLAYYTANIPTLFYRNHERSFLYGWMVKRIQWGLGIGMFFVVAFPFLPHAAIKLGELFGVHDRSVGFIPDILQYSRIGVGVYLIMLTICFFVMFIRPKGKVGIK